MDRSEAFNSLSHLLGAVAALAGLSVLVVQAGMDGDARRIVAFSIYGVTLFLLYLMSTLYHSTRGRAKRVFRIMDYQAIYLLIAGTYTPFTLISLQGTLGWWLFGTIWGLAAVGITMDALPRRRGARVLQVMLYLLMGWLALLALDPLLSALPDGSFDWVLAGGLLYTGGIVFFVLDHWYPWCHGIWHLFVLAGSASHYFAILLYL